MRGNAASIPQLAAVQAIADKSMLAGPGAGQCDERRKVGNVGRRQPQLGRRSRNADCQVRHNGARPGGRKGSCRSLFFAVRVAALATFVAERTPPAFEIELGKMTLEELDDDLL